MGFLEDAGEFLFGTETKKKAQANQDAVQNEAARQQAEAAAMGRQYDQGAAQSMGANAADYMRKASESARGMASENAGIAAKQGAREQIKAMRTAGMGGAAAAARAGQQAGRNYAGTYQQGVQSGVGQYMQGANQFANQGAEMAGRGLQQGTQRLNVAGQQQEQAQQTAQNTMNVGQQALAAGLALSDEREKTGVQSVDNDRISRILAKIDPVRYKYKDESNGTGEQVGITAQNLEQAGLGGAVEEAPDGTKMVNGAKVENFNLDAVKMLNEKVDKIMAMIGGGK